MREARADRLRGRPAVTEVLERLRGDLAARPEVGFAYLFGSAAGGAGRAGSDVDVAVWVAALPEGGREHDLRLALLRLIQNAVGREDVDLVLLHRAPPLLAERVARTGALIFSRDEPRRLRWIVETKSRYCDLRPVRALLDAAVARRVLAGAFGRSRG